MGFAVGLLVAMTGVGAGSIMTPILLFMGFSPVTAVGTDLLCSAFSKALGAGVYFRRGAIRRRILMFLLGGSVLGISLGGVVVIAVRGAYGLAALNLWLGVGIALMLLALGTSYLFGGPFSGSGPDPSPPSSRTLAAFGFIIGLAVDLTSVGAGSMLMPYLMRKVRTVQEMVGTDLAFGSLTTLMAGASQLSLGNVLVGPLALLLAGSVPGTLVGTALNSRVSVTRIRPVLAVLIMAAGASILGRALLG